jgi:hypothetical protein
VSASTIHRPTENEAIGKAMRHPRPRLNLAQLLLDRAATVTRGDWHGHYLLAGRIDRAINPKAGER